MQKALVMINHDGGGGDDDVDILLHDGRWRQ